MHKATINAAQNNYLYFFYNTFIKLYNDNCGVEITYQWLNQIQWLVKTFMNTVQK